MGRYIDIQKESGERFAGYLAEPARGSGPGVLLLQEVFGVNSAMRDMADWFAEEGYVALAPDLFWRSEPRAVIAQDEAGLAKGLQYRAAMRLEDAVSDIDEAIKALRKLDRQAGGVAAVGYGLGGFLAYLAATRLPVDCAVSYDGFGVHEHVDAAGKVQVPMALHLAELDTRCPAPARDAIKAAFSGNELVRIYDYPGVDRAFAAHGRGMDEPVSAGLAHSRTLDLVRAAIGPRYDLAALWEEHIRHEFDTRDVPATMATMVPEPYVNHIPTLTGGVGQQDLSRFYRYHFVHGNPEDTKMIPVSRTVGADRVVDESLFCFTHDREIDWLLPGVPPTGKYVEVPLVAIVHFRGDKLDNEHIYWDQASVLVQVGLLDPEGLPVAGVSQAKKLVDKTLPSNELMAAWASSEGKPVG